MSASRVRHLVLLGFAAAGLVGLACSDSSVEQASPSPDAAAPEDAGAPSTDAAAGEDVVLDASPVAQPKNSPTSLVYVDDEPSCGVAGGGTMIGRARDESDVTEYRLYVGSSPTTKLGQTPLVVTQKLGTDLPVLLPDQTPHPPEATHLLAFTANSAGENPVPKVTPFIKRTTIVPTGTGGPVGWASIDTTNTKVLIVHEMGGKPSLVRCNLDGTGCEPKDLSAGRPGYVAYTLHGLVDNASAKLFAVTTDTTNGWRPSLFHCAIDGTSCAWVDISAGQAGFSAGNIRAVVDSKNAKLLTVSAANGFGYKPALFRCNLDGTSCAYVDISAGQAVNSGDIAVLIDTQADRLLVVAESSATGYHPLLYSCALDGTGCTFTDLASALPDFKATFNVLNAALDETNGKLLVVTADASNGGSNPYILFRCAKDGTACTTSSLGGAVGFGSPGRPSVVADVTNSQILTVVGGTLFRCNIDGQNCSEKDMLGAQRSSSSTSVDSTALIDTVNGRLLVNHGTGALLRTCLR